MFYFALKSSFIFWDIYIFLLKFWLCRKDDDKKTGANSKIYDVTDWTTNNYNTPIV